MSRRRVSPLTIVLPQPPLPRRRSSLLSTGSASSAPRTPRSTCASQACASWVLNPSNRNSTDSWNSSNNDFGDEGDAAEWKADHLVLLSRTLDALPSHLVTPFHGPIPPSNLLDKIARGIAQAKGPVEWPFSLRATRVKLIELARTRARDDTCMFSDENNDTSGRGGGDAAGMPKRRPIYRQSSMDFIYGSITEDQDHPETINRLSARLQRTSDFLPTNHSTFHPYSGRRTLKQRRGSSPPRPGDVPALSPSTPSSSTLNTLSSLSSNRSHNRRSGATLSSMTSNESLSSLGLADAKIPFQLLPSSITSAPDPRVQRVRRSESFCVPPSSSKDSYAFFASATPAPIRQTVKRAPSYGALAQESKDTNRAKAANDGFQLGENLVYPSSDEEEKLRTKHAKKARTRSGSAASPTSPAQSPPTTPEAKQKAVKKCRDTKDPTQSRSAIPKGIDHRSSPSSLGLGAAPVRQRMNPQRNPSMFGHELPHLPSTTTTEVLATYQPPSSPVLPAPKKTPTLRRVKRMGLGPSRRISFGSLVAPSISPNIHMDMENDADVEEDDDGDLRLASAFQLK